MSIDPPQFNLCDYFLSDERLSQIGNQLAIEYRDHRITYNRLRDEVDRCANELSRRGIAEGDRVALLLYDTPAFIACFLASAAIGAVCVPINTFLGTNDIGFILSDSGARLLIVESDLEDKIELPAGAACAILRSETIAGSDSPPGVTDRNRARSPQAATTRESPAFMLYTSGSTGTPKGVLHCHGSIPVTVENYAGSVLHLTSDDR